MIRHGETEVPYHLVSTFTLPPQVAALSAETSSSADKGLFFLEALVSANASPEKIYEYFDR